MGIKDLGRGKSLEKADMREREREEGEESKIGRFHYNLNKWNVGICDVLISM